MKKSLCFFAVFTALLFVFAGAVSAQQTTKQVEEFVILSTQPGEIAGLTDHQVEVLLSQLISPSVRPQVLVGGFQEFRKKYLEATTRKGQEAVLFEFNKDAQALKNAPVELTRPEDVEILPPPAGDKRRWLEIKEWGINEETRMGPTIDCDKDPMAFTKARVLIIKALIERAKIPGFDTARKAAFLRAFDKCLAEGVNGSCKIELATAHPYLDWAVGGKGPAFNLHYNPDPSNERAVNAKTLVVFDEQFAEWYDVGCACGGNLGKKAGVSRKIGFRTEVTENYVLCSSIEVVSKSGQVLGMKADGLFEVSDELLKEGFFVHVLEQPTGPKAGKRLANWLWGASGKKVGNFGDPQVEISESVFEGREQVNVSVESPQGSILAGKAEKVCRITLIRKPKPPIISRNVPSPVEKIIPPKAAIKVVKPTSVPSTPKPEPKIRKGGGNGKWVALAAGVGGGVACAIFCRGGGSPGVASAPGVIKPPVGAPGPQ